MKSQLSAVEKKIMTLNLDSQKLNEVIDNVNNIERLVFMIINGTETPRFVDTHC